MFRFLSILMFAFCVTIAGAQLLPIELDQTITLPVGTNIWDVMPHPDGYYLWVAATEPDTEQTRIYWGRTDVEGFDSLDLDVGEPQSITCFWRDGYEPYVVLTSQRWVPGWYPPTMLDITLMRVYRLSDGLADTRQWNFTGSMYIHPFGYSNWVHSGYRPLLVAPAPLPPLVSTHVTLQITHSYNSGGSAHGWSGSSSSNPCRLVMDMLSDSSNQGLDLPGSAGSAVWSPHLNSVALAYSGATNGWSSYFGHGSEYSSSSVRIIRTLSDYPFVVDTLWNCSLPSENACPQGVLAMTYTSASESFYCFARIANGYGAIRSPWNSGPLWTTPYAYDFALAVEVVPGTGTEEFLAYTLGHFDIYDASSGQFYGAGGPITIAQPGTRIIGRYNEPLRRLATRSGYQLRLYRFGDYAGALAALSQVEAGPPQWGYRLQVLNGEISRVVFSPVCPTTTGRVSGPDESHWTVTNAGDSINFECSPPVIGNVLDTLFLSHSTCDSMVHWQAGVSYGTIAGPYRTGLAMQATEMGPPRWGYHPQLYSAEVSRMVFSPVCSGATANVSGPEANRWTITYVADSVVFASTPPAIGAVLDTFFLSHPVCAGTVNWQSGLSEGSVAGPYQPIQVVQSGPPLWGYHLELYGQIPRVVFSPVCSGTTASVSGPDAPHWALTSAGDSLVFESSPPVFGAVLDTFFLSHSICSGTVHWNAGSAGGTIPGPYQSSHLVTLNAVTATNEESGIRVSFRTVNEHDVAFYEVWRASGLSEPFAPVATLASHGNSDTLQSYVWLDENVSWRIFYFYFILDEDILGSRTEHRDHAISVYRDPAVVPLYYSLSASPNPFNSITNIRFTTRQREYVRLTIYNLEGRLVKVMTDQQYEPGHHSIQFNAIALPSGIYFAHIVTEGGFVATQKLMLLK